MDQPQSAIPEPRKPPSGTSVALNCFSVDVEEYFHCEAFARTVAREQWQRLERRALPRIERIAELLAENESRATFFVLGWMVEHLTPMLRMLHASGHEIACHGDAHEHLSRLTPETFRADVCAARKRLEDAIGARVTGYRAPTFSLTRATAWAADVLCAEEFEYDSSIFPIRHDRYGVSDAPCLPFWLETRCGRLLELPPLTLDWRVARVPVGGGGYLRVLPGFVMRAAIAARQRQGAASMIYVHPWELDPHQPQLPASRLSRWRHRVNLHQTAGKLIALLRQFRFDTARSIARRLTSGTPLQSFGLRAARNTSQRRESGAPTGVGAISETK